jgi:hypothetical protein
MGLRPVDFLTRYSFRCPRRWRALLHANVGFGGLDYPFTILQNCLQVRCCPSSLYTFPAACARPGLARDRHLKGFPDFEQFYIGGFPREHSSLV